MEKIWAALNNEILRNVVCQAIFRFAQTNKMTEFDILVKMVKGLVEANERLIEKMIQTGQNAKMSPEPWKEGG